MDTAGRMTHFAGHNLDKNKQANCGCNSTLTTSNPKQRDTSFVCSCEKNDETMSNAETLLSSNAKFQAISAITVLPDGVLYVADQGLFFFSMLLVWHILDHIIQHFYI